MSHPSLRDFFWWVCRRMQVLALHIVSWYLISIPCLNKNSKIGMFLGMLVLSFRNQFVIIPILKCVVLYVKCWWKCSGVICLISRNNNPRIFQMLLGAVILLNNIVLNFMLYIWNELGICCIWPYSEMRQIVLNFASLVLIHFKLDWILATQANYDVPV